MLGLESPYVDVECMVMAVTVVEALGLKDIQLHINSLGDEESRNAYREALKNHFQPALHELCYDCQSKIYNMPKPGEDWGKQIGTCECCDCAIWEKDINKEGASFCPNCGSPLE